MSFVENRRAKRLSIDMTIALYDISKNRTHEDAEAFSVEVVDISQTGLGFVSEVPVEVNSFYKAKLVFPTKDSMDVIIEVVRSNVKEDGQCMYGGSFVALNETDKFKIEVFRLFEEENRKSQ